MWTWKSTQSSIFSSFANATPHIFAPEAISFTFSKTKLCFFHWLIMPRGTRSMPGTSCGMVVLLFALLVAFHGSDNNVAAKCRSAGLAGCTGSCRGQYGREYYCTNFGLFPFNACFCLHGSGADDFWPPDSTLPLAIKGSLIMRIGVGTTVKAT